MPEPERTAIALPPVVVERHPLRFHWQDEGLAGPFTLVLMAGDYREVLRVDGIGDCSYEPDAATRARLDEQLGSADDGHGGGDLCHCVVFVDGDGRVCRSALASFAAH